MIMMPRLGILTGITILPTERMATITTPRPRAFTLTTGSRKVTITDR